MISSVDFASRRIALHGMSRLVKRVGAREGYVQSTQFVSLLKRLSLGWLLYATPR